MNELAVFAQYNNNNLVADSLCCFFTNFTKFHCRLNTELLIVCKVALQYLFVTLHVLQFQA